MSKTHFVRFKPNVVLGKKNRSEIIRRKTLEIFSEIQRVDEFWLVKKIAYFRNHNPSNFVRIIIFKLF